MAACAPLIAIGCIAGSRAPPRVMVRADWPGPFAMNVSVTTAPCPETPPAPGGRVAVICSVPVAGSSRCTNATACPSCDRKPPFETLTTCN